MPVDANGLQILSPDKSMQLLSMHLPHVGRIALSTDEGAPVIFPINYRVVDTDGRVAQAYHRVVVHRASPRRRLGCVA